MVVVALAVRTLLRVAPAPQGGNVWNVLQVGCSFLLETYVSGWQGTYGVDTVQMDRSFGSWLEWAFHVILILLYALSGNTARLYASHRFGWWLAQWNNARTRRPGHDAVKVGTRMQAGRRGAER
jgi:hypothetical protein